MADISSTSQSNNDIAQRLTELTTTSAALKKTVQSSCEEMRAAATVRTAELRTMEAETRAAIDELEKINKKSQKENAILMDILLNGKARIWRFARLEEPNATVFVTTLTGKRIPIHVTVSSTIEDIKQQIQTQEGIPFFTQRLIFGGYQLLDHHTLIHYRITNGSIIHLVLNMRNQERWRPLGLTKEKRRDIVLDNFEHEELQRKAIQKREYKIKYG